jgi:2-C-methyl-D-erythritol 4-phosphate cytidylyltransferase/2-C-methyl-D-erythritol 2,4-cyclodiphosphate synthase
VLIHDAARPFVGARHVRALLTALSEADGAIPALPVADTLKKSEAEGAVVTVSRDHLWRAQTPQAFRRDRLLAAYAAWPTDGAEPTDDAGVVERAGGVIALAPGDPLLMKLTYPEDFTMAEALIAALDGPPGGEARVTCIGQGFDAHRFGPGDAVWLCGVKIAHDKTLIGHSDADAGLHALTDALLGAIGEGDIGDHFPPTDPKWRGVDSAVFLQHAAGLVRAKGGTIVNVDVTLICERPRIKIHREAMRERLGELLGLPLARVSVKATTTERMGFTGREEGLAAQAIAAVSLPG